MPTKSPSGVKATFDGDATLFKVATSTAAYCVKNKLVQSPFCDPLTKVKFKKVENGETTIWSVQANTVELERHTESAIIYQKFKTSEAPKLKDLFKPGTIEFSCPSEKDDEKAVAKAPESEETDTTSDEILAFFASQNEQVTRVIRTISDDLTAQLVARAALDRS